MEEGGGKMTMCDGVEVRGINTCKYDREKRVNDESE